MCTFSLLSFFHTPALHSSSNLKICFHTSLYFVFFIKFKLQLFLTLFVLLSSFSCMLQEVRGLGGMGVRWAFIVADIQQPPVGYVWHCLFIGDFFFLKELSVLSYGAFLDSTAFLHMDFCSSSNLSLLNQFQRIWVLEIWNATLFYYVHPSFICIPCPVLNSSGSCSLISIYPLVALYW